MNAEHFTLFLLTYFFVAVSICISTISFKSRSPFKNQLSTIVFTILALAGLALSVVIGSLVVTGENFVIGMLSKLTSFSRLHITAFGLGASCALPLALLWLRNETSSITRYFAYTLSFFGILGTLLFGGLSAGKEALSPYLPHPDSDVKTGNNLAGGLAPKGFVIEDLVDTKLIPVRIAVSPSGKIYVSGHVGIAAQSGAIVEIVANEKGGYQEKQVATHLNRPYGLIAEDDRLFVSRSGQHAKWNKGKVEFISTGAVTMLKDLDGDGVMDYYHDIVSALPGAKGPDHLHQNNDIAIDKDGALYITTANHSDGHPTRHEWEGVILKASGENFENVEVFATGIRNAFGLEFNANGELFASDNDAQTGILGGNMGDKLIHITEDAFFGHPYGHEGNAGVAHHALRSKFALGGLALSSDKLPDEYKNKLFLVVYGEGKIMRVDLEKVDGNYNAKLTPFATVPGVVDVAAAPNGDFYAVVYPDKIVRIRQLSSN